MKLEADVNEVVLSNVGASGEFKIRNSAKAFKILSDGLYSNKIKAIIRELSCNALDSHVGAGCANKPFEVHLPTIFEPWFAVRDFGLGLDANQVVNIYTTYFESTKTDSNAFIGALGLGSKSPFSYTENFTVTAIKDGVQRIYSAFINEQGVPSIAEMSQNLTDEGNGVEVKFSVTDRSDYNTFKNESKEVFKWFGNKPTITGLDDFEHLELDYKEMNIVPGVHTQKPDHYGRYQTGSVALMGNIPYPLNNIPAPEKHLKGLEHLLGCGLVLEFDIGDLDFAASREHLSYIPSTLASIKRKLTDLNANLTIHLAAKADAIVNHWERAFYLQSEYSNPLYKAAVGKYVNDTKFELFDLKAYHGLKKFELGIGDLDKRQLEIRGFSSRHGSSSILKPGTSYNTNPAGGHTYIQIMGIPVEKTVVIVLNDLKTGCIARARYHFNLKRDEVTVYCLSHSSPDLAERELEYKKIIAELHNPPVVVKASELEKQVRERPVSTQGIMRMRTKSGCSEGSEHSYMWEPYRDELVDDVTYYYVTLTNHTANDQSGAQLNMFYIKSLMDTCGVDSIKNIQILGVRKNRIKELKALDNWVWFEEILKEETAKISDSHIASLVVAELLDSYYNRVYTDKTVAKAVGPDSDYAKYVAQYGGIKRKDGNAASLARLGELYGKSIQVSTVKKSIEDTKTALFAKYPFLQLCRDGNDTVSKTQIADYIMMIDKQEKI